VLDEWFENEVKPRLKGNSTLVRFADDAVIAFADFHDAKRGPIPLPGPLESKSGMGFPAGREGLVVES